VGFRRWRPLVAGRDGNVRRCPTRPARSHTASSTPARGPFFGRRTTRSAIRAQSRRRRKLRVDVPVYFSSQMSTAVSGPSDINIDERLFSCFFSSSPLPSSLLFHLSSSVPLVFFSLLSDAPAQSAQIQPAGPARRPCTIPPCYPDDAASASSRSPAHKRLGMPRARRIGDEEPVKRALPGQTSLTPRTGRSQLCMTSQPYMRWPPRNPLVTALLPAGASAPGARKSRASHARHGLAVASSASPALVAQLAGPPGRR